jgi:AAA domain
MNDIDFDQLVAELEAPDTAASRHAGSRIEWSTFWDRDGSEHGDWLVEPLLARGRQHAVYALQKAGKSLIMVGIAGAVATGRPVLGHSGADPVPVLYLDFEQAEDDLRDRLEDFGYGPDDNLSLLHYHLLPHLDPLDTPAGAREVVELAHEYDAQLVVIDTTTSATAGEENVSDTMRRFFRFCGQPLKREGRTLVRLDHAGKNAGKGQRGSSAKADDVDVVWHLARAAEERIRLEATHRRMTWVPPRVDIELRGDPQRLELASETWPPGTEDLAAQLEDLGVPMSDGRPAARRVLTEAGVTASNELLSAALRYRRRKEVS